MKMNFPKKTCNDEDAVKQIQDADDLLLREHQFYLCHSARWWLPADEKKTTPFFSRAKWLKVIIIHLNVVEPKTVVAALVRWFGGHRCKLVLMRLGKLFLNCLFRWRSQTRGFDEKFRNNARQYYRTKNIPWIISKKVTVCHRKFCIICREPHSS